MKSLATIQKMAKAGKILSRLVFILCLIAFGFGAALLILFAQAGQTTLPDGISFAALLRMEGNVTLEELLRVLHGHSAFLCGRSGDRQIRRALLQA